MEMPRGARGVSISSAELGGTRGEISPKRQSGKNGENRLVRGRAQPEGNG